MPDGAHDHGTSGRQHPGAQHNQPQEIEPDLSFVKAWRLEQFIDTMRTAVDPGGHTLTERMPWRRIGRMDDGELTAVSAFLTGLPERK